MRVLCLHDSNSSGPLLLQQLETFAKKLFQNHAIELVFVNSPLISSNNRSTCTRRTWFHEDNNYLGLDASILNLNQIWKQSLHSDPFCGILGIGQGAAMASLLPLLQSENHFDQEGEGEEEAVEGEETGGDGDKDATCTTNHRLHNSSGNASNNDDDDQDGLLMFDGIKFCIFFNGYDLLKQQTDNDCSTRKNHVQEEDKEEEECFYYHEVRNLPSLHIITQSSSSSKDSASKSEILYQRYCGGGQQKQQTSPIAKLHYVQTYSLDISVLNTMGKFLVKQKKTKKKIEEKVHMLLKKNSHQEKENLFYAINNNDNNNNDNTMTTTMNEITVEIEKTKFELSMAQNEAQSIMTSAIMDNPPKALMAVITPPSMNKDDGTLLVGGWDGDKDAFRSEEFKISGGAPCPKEFTLKQTERKKY